MVFRALYSAETLRALVIDTIGKDKASVSMKEVEKRLPCVRCA
jgi:hypothetical protein